MSGQFDTARSADRFPFSRAGFRLTLLLCSALALTGCALPGARAPKEETFPKLVDHTFAIYDSGNGLQIEYLAPDGYAYLWYPQNRFVLKSQWKVDNLDLCFKYPSYSRHGVTGESGGEWECRFAGWWLKYRIKESASGDLFDLSKNLVTPFVMDKSVPFADKTALWTLADVKIMVDEKGVTSAPLQ